MIDLNLKLLKNGATHLRDNGDVRYLLSYCSCTVVVKMFHSTLFV